jgi:type IV pilus assembly protein PilX
MAKIRTPAATAQAGAVLIAALIILVVLTLLGIASIDTTGIEMKMANNAGDQQQAFESAEYILNAVENDFIQKNTLDAQIATSCSGNKCFNSTCSNGYCFFGINPTAWDNCRPYSTTSTAANPWEAKAAWSDARSIPLVPSPNAETTVRYMVEFRCYVPTNPMVALSAANATKLFRITAYVIGPGNKGRVMLQSTVKQL